MMARLFAGRLHYAWVVVAVMFVVILASVGVRATPGVLIVPLQRGVRLERGGDLGCGVAEHPAVRAGRAVRRRADPGDRVEADGAGSMVLLVIGAGLSAFVTEIWQLYLTWGVLVGLDSGAGMVGLATAIANRWFVQRRGLVVGLLTASNASGQLVFLPLLASLVVSHRLAHRAAGGGGGDPGADPGGAADAAGKPGLDRARAVRVDRRSWSCRRGRAIRS